MVTPSTKSGAEAAGIAPLDQARALGRDAWEALLVAHYLRSDGPFGSTPLQSLDATPVELANATSFDGLDPENAKRVIAQGLAVAWVTVELPGRFHRG